MVELTTDETVLDGITAKFFSSWDEVGRYSRPPLFVISKQEPALLSSVISWKAPVSYDDNSNN